MCQAVKALPGSWRLILSPAGKQQVQSYQNTPDTEELAAPLCREAGQWLMCDTYIGIHTFMDKTSMFCSELKVATTQDLDAQILTIENVSIKF